MLNGPAKGAKPQIDSVIQQPTVPVFAMSEQRNKTYLGCTAVTITCLLPCRSSRRSQTDVQRNPQKAADKGARESTPVERCKHHHLQVDGAVLVETGKLPPLWAVNHEISIVHGCLEAARMERDIMVQNGQIREDAGFLTITALVGRLISS